jgi:hypothetical protein
MSAPVADQSGVDRATAKVAVLGAMYGQTTGPGAQALRRLKTAYPVAADPGFRARPADGQGPLRLRAPRPVCQGRRTPARAGALMEHITQFLLELGADSRSPARQHRFTLVDSDFMIDLPFSTSWLGGSPPVGCPCRVSTSTRLSDLAAGSQIARLPRPRREEAPGGQSGGLLRPPGGHVQRTGSYLRWQG